MRIFINTLISLTRVFILIRLHATRVDECLKLPGEPSANKDENNETEWICDQNFELIKRIFMTASSQDARQHQVGRSHHVEQSTQVEH